MYLIGILIWTLVSCVVAWLLAYGLTRRAKAHWPRWVTTAVLFPVVFITPLADEIVGKYQFERLCEEAKEVKIYGTIPVGEELYTSDGKWRRGETRAEMDQLRKTYEALLKWDLGSPLPEEIHAAIPIHRYHTRVFGAQDGRLLAEWEKYATPGGWLSQRIPGGQNTFLTTGVCMPDMVQRSELKLHLLPFTIEGATK